MKKTKGNGFVRGAVTEIITLFLCFVAAFIVVVSMGYLVALFLRRDMTSNVVMVFYLASICVWILLYCLSKKSLKIRTLLGVDFAQKPINGKRIVPVLLVVVFLLGCFAISHVLTSALCAVIGLMPEAQSTREFWGLNIILFALLLVPAKKFFWSKLYVGNQYLSRSEIIQGLALTVGGAAIILGALIVAYFTAFALYALFSGQRVPDEGAPFFYLLWQYSYAVVFFLLRWYIRQSNLAKNIHILSDIMDALESIARGDFSIRLNHDLKEDEPFAKLVRSVNDMARNLGQTEIMRQEFISNVSHEIQSPLASIKGFAYVLHNEELTSEERSHFLDIIEIETTRLSRLSENLLKLAALDANSVKFEPVPYRLDKQILELILSCEPQWKEKNITIEAQLDEITVIADKDMMSQVWVNLIYNSIKFTPKDGTIQVELQRRGSNIECKISDTGIGMDKETQQHIFERFYKADKARERTKKGSGLGLAIAKKVIDTHNGTIMVESEPGKGTAFTVLLPL